MNLKCTRLIYLKPLRIMVIFVQMFVSLSEEDSKNGNSYAQHERITKITQIWICRATAVSASDFQGWKLLLVPFK